MSAEDGLPFYRLYRGRVVEEDGLINHRMNWMLWSTAILLALWGALMAASFQDKLANEWFRLPLSATAFIVACMGEVIAIQSLIAITAARTEVERLSEEYKILINKTQIVFDYRVCESVTGETTKHLSGYLSAKWIPWIFIGIWFVLAAGSFGASAVNLSRLLENSKESGSTANSRNDAGGIVMTSRGWTKPS